MTLGADRIAMTSVNLPYDAEIEYLQGDGSAYIDTGINLMTFDDAAFKITVTFMYDSLPYTENPIISTWSVASNKFNLFITNAGQLDCYWDAHYYKSITISTWETVSFCQDIGYFGNKVAFLMTTRLINDYYGTTTVKMFARGDLDGKSRVKIKNTKIYSKHGLEYDFIPVRVGQIGYMYDKISGQLFGNSGTGSFVLGPDV